MVRVSTERLAAWVACACAARLVGATSPAPTQGVITWAAVDYSSNPCGADGDSGWSCCTSQTSDGAPGGFCLRDSLLLDGTSSAVWTDTALDDDTGAAVGLLKLKHTALQATSLVASGALPLVVTAEFSGAPSGERQISLELQGPVQLVACDRGLCAEHDPSIGCATHTTAPLAARQPPLAATPPTDCRCVISPAPARRPPLVRLRRLLTPVDGPRRRRSR